MTSHTMTKDDGHYKYEIYITYYNDHAVRGYTYSLEKAKDLKKKIKEEDEKVKVEIVPRFIKFDSLVKRTTNVLRWVKHYDQDYYKKITKDTIPNIPVQKLLKCERFFCTDCTSYEKCRILDTFEHCE